MNAAGFYHPLAMSTGNVPENEGLGIIHQQGQKARYVSDFVMNADYFNPYRISADESPDIIRQQTQQAQFLIDFLRCLPSHIRAKMPRVNENVMAQADGIRVWADIIRVWMSHSKEIRTLRSLNLFGSNLTNLPPEIGFFRHLRQLNLSNNRLTALPAEFGNLTALRECSLSTNQLTALPVEIGNLTALEHLNLSHNQLATLPTEIGDLAALRVLDLTRNQLAVLPAEIGNLTALRELYVLGNKLVVLPAEIGNLTALRELYLFDNRLVALPAEIGNLRALRGLHLSYNRLVALPAEIGNLGALMGLTLTHNQLTALPAEIGNLAALVELDLIDNQLGALPAEIGNLAALRRLFIRNNQFAISPPEIANLMELQCDLPSPLQVPLRAWSSEFERAFPQEERVNTAYWDSRTTNFAPLISLPIEENQSFVNYLQRLRQTRDYRIGEAARKNVILRVERMVQLACKNPEFKYLMLAAIAEGLESCGDRVLITFNEIEIQWQFHHKKLTDDEFRSLAIRASRYRCLEEYAKKICLERGLGDEIETILFYQIQLREALNLPITTEGMLYPAMSGVSPEMLKAAQEDMKSLSNEYLLAKSDYWQARMAAQHSVESEEVAVKYATLLETVEEYYHCDAEKRDDWLKAHDDPELREILKELNYDTAARLIMSKRAIDLSKLGASAAAARK